MLVILSTISKQFAMSVTCRSGLSILPLLRAHGEDFLALRRDTVLFVVLEGDEEGAFVDVDESGRAALRDGDEQLLPGQRGCPFSGQSREFVDNELLVGGDELNPLLLLYSLGVTPRHREGGDEKGGDQPDGLHFSLHVVLPRRRALRETPVFQTEVYYYFFTYSSIRQECRYLC